MTIVAPHRPQLPSGQLRARRAPDWMLRQLPNQMVSQDFFRRFVSIFQELGSTLLDDADNVENIVDVTVAPLEFVRWLGSWIGAAVIDPAMPEDLQRRMVTSASRTLTWRGTATGLRQFLELLSDGPVEVVDGGGIFRPGESPQDPAWVRITVATTGQLAPAEFVALVKDEIPAHVRAELYVGSDRVWSSEDDQ